MYMVSLVLKFNTHKTPLNLLMDSLNQTNILKIEHIEVLK